MCGEVRDAEALGVRERGQVMLVGRTICARSASHSNMRATSFAAERSVSWTFELAGGYGRCQLRGGRPNQDALIYRSSLMSLYILAYDRQPAI
jgi:hypothetical protein